MLFCLGLHAFGDWKINFGLKGDWTYDSNVFYRSASQIDTFNAKDPRDAASGRFQDMNSIGDQIINPAFTLRAGGPSIFGRKLDMALSFNYDKYLNNTRKDHYAIGLNLRQSLWKGGRLIARGRYVPKEYQRNFLVDGVAGSDGSVLRQDRIYRAATYRDSEAGLEYEQRLLEKRRTGGVGLTGRLGASLYRRRYPLEFRGRDRDSLNLEAGLGLDFKGGSEITFGYRHENAKRPIVSEILLLDEPAFNIDFNGDGDVLDNNIRTETQVNRSYRADHFEGALLAAVGKNTDLRLSLSRRLRTYLSQEPHDGYSGLKDKRWIARIELDQKISSGLSFVAGYAYNAQRLSHMDVTGDEEDYVKHVVQAGLSVRF
jgi:hypothetical protein